MKKCTLFTLFVLVPFVCAGCGIPLPGGLLEEISITGSGNLVTQEAFFTGFDEVDVSHGFTADISQGDNFSVVVSIDDNLVQYVEVVKEGSTLKIGLTPGRIYTISDATLQAEVTMPELPGLDLSGGSHSTITGFESTKTLEVDLSGASHLEGDIEAGDAQFDISGGSHATLSGSGQDVIIDASGASHVDLGDFLVADASVEASGASHVTVKPSGTLNVDASGASHVYYLGSPSLGTIDESGGSLVGRR